MLDEGDFFHGEKRQERKERKIAQNRDRSKYKVSNLKQKGGKEKRPLGSLAKVLSAHLDGFEIITSEGKRLLAKVKGVLRKERRLEKTHAVIGDDVIFEALGENEALILEIAPRKSLLSRQDNLARHNAQAIAANVDMVLIVVGLVEPPLKVGLVDRYLVASYKGSLEPIVVVNKTDLLENNPDEARLYRDFVAAWGPFVRIVSVSCEKKEGFDELLSQIAKKTCVVTGQSGVGKSSLINILCQSNQKTGQTVCHSKKGSHTTSVASLIPLAGGGYCIDTPGIKSFGVWDLDSSELKHYYDDFVALSHQCRFHNCLHINEPDCAVLAAVGTGAVHPLRYDSYRAIYDSLEQGHQNR